ncbi:MAG: hypothetical protein AAGJ31_03830, partial [Verrucomicrobiota bacterium]
MMFWTAVLWMVLGGGVSHAQFRSGEGVVQFLAPSSSGKIQLFWVRGRVVPWGGGTVAVWASSSSGKKAVASAAVKQSAELWKAKWPATGHRLELEVLPGLGAPNRLVAPLTLLFSSFVTGATVDSSFAVTGFVDEEGNLKALANQEVEEVLRAAILAKIGHVALPMGNHADLEDILAAGGYQGLLRMQVFGVTRVPEFRGLGLKEEGTSQSSATLAAFERVRQERFGAGFSTRTLKAVPTRDALREVVILDPTHLSAQLLLAASEGRAPSSLSL